MTPRTLDTEWIEYLSPLDHCGLLRNETKNYGMDVFQSNTHGVNKDEKILEAG